MFRPSYWFFETTKCPPNPLTMPPIQPPPDNSTCIIYFNICKAQTYQCAGTVCGRYLNTTDLVVLLGTYRYEPFKEGK